jgi:thiol-disulfide isomerase/thioredoxin
MSLDLVKTIAYLENQDFDSQGNLIANVPKNVPVVIMIQAGWCPHCVSSKPAFQEFANKYQGKVFCATIQSDGVRESEKKLGKRVKDIKPSFRGFPDYVLYIGGKRVDKEVKGRDVQNLVEFAGL